MMGGVRAGLKTILVLSGSTGRAEAEAYGPDLIFDDIASLTRAWRGAPAPGITWRQASDVK
jgi:ribonucleotide monophosphatase NagD (HAD superfamily)